MEGRSIQERDDVTAEGGSIAGCKLRVAYITSQFPSPPETFATNEIRHLRLLGVEVEVHALRPEHREAATIARDRGVRGVSVTHHTWRSYMAGLRYGLMHPTRLLELLTWTVRVGFPSLEQLGKSLAVVPRALEILERLEQDPPDVVHLYWCHYPSLVGHLVQRYLPQVTTSISFVAHDIDTAWRGTREVARRADVLRTLTRANLPLIERYFGLPVERVAVIYDALDTERADALLAPLAAGKVPKSIVTAGRLVVDKGMDEVLEVFAEAYRKHPDATLVILGDGPERSRLEAKAQGLGIASAVTFRGHVNHDEVLAEMARATVFLFLSKSERLPNVVKEAMYCKCYCIATDTLGMDELIPNVSHGYLVPVAAPHQALPALLEALEHPEGLQQRVGCRAKAYVREHFAINKAVGHYLALWQTARVRRDAEAGPEGEERVYAQG